MEENISDLESKGFSIHNNIYSTEEISAMTTLLDSINTSKPTFRKSEDLFAIRQFFKEVPKIKHLVLNDEFKKLLQSNAGEDYFLVKSIYFDKPEKSNWFVSYHQDLTISVDNKQNILGFINWTSKHKQFSVQPPMDILENIITLRIHLDNTDQNNGALKVIENSHSKKLYRSKDIDFTAEKETYCTIDAGGIMLMKPLLLHGSNRTTNTKRRRVIHLEFSNKLLPDQLEWAEYDSLK